MYIVAISTLIQAWMDKQWCCPGFFHVCGRHFTAVIQQCLVWFAMRKVVSCRNWPCTHLCSSHWSQFWCWFCHFDVDSGLSGFFVSVAIIMVPNFATFSFNMPQGSLFDWFPDCILPWQHSHWIHFHVDLVFIGPSMVFGCHSAQISTAFAKICHEEAAGPQAGIPKPLSPFANH